MQKSTERRETIIRAATELVPEVGSDNVTHRMVAERADVPLGSTTYYFDSIDDLVHEALHAIAESTRSDLEQMEERLSTADDVVRELSQVIWEYLQNRDQLMYWNELYTSANHRPELAEMALLWSDGLIRILNKHMNNKAAQATAMFIDGTLLRVNVSDDLPSFEIISESIARLCGIDPTHDDVTNATAPQTAE